MKVVHRKNKNRIPNSLREALADSLVPNKQKGKEYIYRRYYGYIMAIVFRYIRDEMEAEELTNESFVKAFNKLDFFEQNECDNALEKTFRSWIARIAVNSCIDALRRKKQITMIDDLPERDTLRHSVDNMQQLDVNDIMKLLHRLPDIQKSIFNLYEIEGYSHEEISKALGIPESTSRTYLARAKQRLRKLYVSYFSDTKEMPT